MGSGVPFARKKAKIYSRLNLLDAREQEVIRGRFGLPDGEEKAQREIAEELGISRSYVSRIEKRALAKLLHEFRPKNRE
jgi:RNA polymerase sporulation-specific sigma factor